MPKSTPAKIRVPLPQTPTSPAPPSTTVRTEQDLEAEDVRKSLRKGYQSLALIATFLSGVEAQIITFMLSDGDKSSPAYEALNTIFLVAIILSMFGAVTATLSMRWCGIVPKQSAKLLAHRRSYDQGQIDEDLPHPTHCATISELLLAFALNSCLWLTGAGFLIFTAGILTYTWVRQRRPVAIVTSIATASGLFCMCLFYVPFEFEYVIRNLHFVRFRLRFLPASRRARRREDVESKV